MGAAQARMLSAVVQFLNLHPDYTSSARARANFRLAFKIAAAPRYPAAQTLHLGRRNGGAGRQRCPVTKKHHRQGPKGREGNCAKGGIQEALLINLKICFPSLCHLVTVSLF